MTDALLAERLQHEEATRAVPLAVLEGQPPQTSRGTRATLRRQLLQTDREFTPEDYDMLLRLDSDAQPHRRPKTQVAHVCSLLRRLPVHAVVEGAGGNQCSICLEPMAVGAEVRTLPCMHVFHRGCIDRWLEDPGGPRCPIDQADVSMSALH